MTIVHIYILIESSVTSAAVHKYKIRRTLDD